VLGAGNGKQRGFVGMMNLRAASQVRRVVGKRDKQKHEICWLRESLPETPDGGTTTTGIDAWDKQHMT